MIALVFTLELLAAVLLWRIGRRLARLERLQSLLRVAQAEAACLEQARERLRDQQQQVERAIGAGTDSVEAVHRAIADLSFDIWGPQATRARQRHADTAERIYGTARALNRSAGGLLRAWLKEDRRDDSQDK